MARLREGIGRRLRQLRHAAGLTQQELAKRVEVDWKHLGTIERGEQNPSLDLLERVIDVLEIEPWELFLFDLKESAVSPKVEEDLVLKLLRRGDSASRRYLLRHAEQFLRWTLEGKRLR